MSCSCKRLASAWCLRRGQGGEDGQLALVIAGRSMRPQASARLWFPAEKVTALLGSSSRAQTYLQARPGQASRDLAFTHSLAGSWCTLTGLSPVLDASQGEGDAGLIHTAPRGLLSHIDTGLTPEASLSQGKGHCHYKSSCNWEPTFFSNWRKKFNWNYI